MVFGSNTSEQLPWSIGLQYIMVSEDQRKAGMGSVMLTPSHERIQQLYSTFRSVDMRHVQSCWLLVFAESSDS